MKAHQVPEDSEVFSLIQQLKLNGFIQEQVRLYFLLLIPYKKSINSIFYFQTLTDHLLVPIRGTPAVREGGMVDDQSFQRQRRTSFYYSREGEQQGFNQQRRSDNQTRRPERRTDLYNMV